MNTLITLALSFIFLYLGTVWLALYYLGFERQPMRRYPSVTIAVPAHNEADNLDVCVRSILASNYPKAKLTIIIIDDGSTDATPAIAARLASMRRPHSEAMATPVGGADGKVHERGAKIRVLRKNKEGKSVALNAALAIADTELFGVLDADSTIHPDALRNLVPLIEQGDAKEGSVAAGITSIRVRNDQSAFGAVQRIEYLMAALMRKIISTIGTLWVTPGVLSVYRTDILRQVHGFDHETMTEDLEVAMRLKEAGYCIEMAHDSITYTDVPEHMDEFWRQRIRWSRGFIQNHLRYRNMVFNRKYGTWGWFQLPLNIIGPPLLLLSLLVIIINTVQGLYEFVFRSIIIRDYFLSRILNVPTLKELLLGQNFRIFLPIFISSCVGLYILYAAHSFGTERLKQPGAILLFLMVLPYVTLAYWISASVQELFQLKRRW
ncbi:hypothetical protein AUJ68_06560 [Candidatus Woesearchaeota archaeon CG1_02_57_44]|nr:MAG: hypothetical protein AUJ68_06560 [Candidatus Woesearchaeota archaeon CG1_02_57_44]